MRLSGEDEVWMKEFSSAGACLCWHDLESESHLMKGWNTMSRTTWICAFALACGLLAACPVAYGGIPIVNASFEDPVLAEDDWTWNDVPGWTLVNSDDDNGAGVWNTSSYDFDPPHAPEGQNVAYTEIAPDETVRGISQVLTTTFAANTDYTLTVEVGNSYDYYWSGYTVQLLAGGTILKEDNNTLWPAYYKWATSTVAYTYDSAHAGLVGEDLEIRLLNLGKDMDLAAPSVVGVEFDDVQLTPEPATMSLLALGGLALLRRKRK